MNELVNLHQGNSTRRPPLEVDLIFEFVGVATDKVRILTLDK